jgi:K+-sensing histidine kinase KdpD
MVILKSQVKKSGINTQGLGLGLYISAEIIRKHGGEIGVLTLWMHRKEYFKGGKFINNTF